MHDFIQYDPIPGQCQGHEPFKVGNPAIFKSYLLHHLHCELATDQWLLNYGIISKFDPVGFLIFGLVFVSRDFEIGTVRPLWRVDRQSHMGLIYSFVRLTPAQCCASTERSVGYGLCLTVRHTPVLYWTAKLIELVFTIVHYGNAIYADDLSVLSVTSQSSTKMAKRRITKSTSYNSPTTLVFWRQRSLKKFSGVTPMLMPNTDGDFLPISRYISEMVQDPHSVLPFISL